MPPNTTKPFVSTQEWRIERPHILIVACSDGRYQQSLDEFLSRHLGVNHYDRLYAPGGPGSLASSMTSYFRGEQFRQEATFLVDAHGIESVIFIFHGPMHGEGPPEATCADYLRKMPGTGTQEIYTRQELDLQEAVAAVRRASQTVQITAYRAEVRADKRVRFVALPIGLTGQRKKENGYAPRKSKEGLPGRAKRIYRDGYSRSH